MRQFKIILCLALLTPFSGPRAEASPIRRVILASIDGMKPEYVLDADKYGLKIPVLRRILREGFHAEGAESVFPAVTYPSHTSMITGVNPGTHGIVTNLAWDPWERNKKGWRWYSRDIRAKTLLEAAREKGLKTAVSYWPVTVSARADFLIPQYWRAGTADDLKLLRALSTPGLPAGYFDIQGFEGESSHVLLMPSSRHLGDIGVDVVSGLKPGLFLFYIPDVDHQEHMHGPFSSEADAAVEEADAQLGRLIDAARKAGTWDETALVVLSDHGFAPTSTMIRPGTVLREKGWVSLDSKGRVTAWRAVVLTAGGMAYLYLNPSGGAPRAKDLRKAFLPLAKDAAKGIRKIWSASEIKAAGGDPGAALALEARPGFYFQGGYSGAYAAPAFLKGQHGYSPKRKSMRASLLVFGPHIGRGSVRRARLIDVAPTIAAWLGLEMKGMQGKPLPVPLR